MDYELLIMDVMNFLAVVPLMRNAQLSEKLGIKEINPKISFKGALRAEELYFPLVARFGKVKVLEAVTATNPSASSSKDDLNAS